MVPINTVTWSMWLVEFRGKGRVGCLLDCLCILALLVVSGWWAVGAGRLYLEDFTRPDTRLWDVRKARKDQPSC